MKKTMHTCLCLLISLALPAADNDEAVKKEKKALAGGWTVMKAERDGEAIPEDEVRKLRLSFGEDRVALKQGEKTNQLRYRIIDPTAKPRSMELIAGDGPQKDKPLVAIYELSGDNLKICMPLKPEVAPPEGFSTSSGSGLMLMILKREK
jgi:uncharacterized protein (TIGR03067 family)